MFPVNARAVYIKKEASEDPRSMARIEGMMPFIHCDTAPVVVDDAALERVIIENDLHNLPNHATDADTIEPIVILNQFLNDHSDEERAYRRESFPELFRSGPTFDPYSGYGGFDWRKSGSEDYRQQTGLICQPAYAIHSIWGCHFRCNYCGLGGVANVYVNLEDWIDHVRDGLDHLRNSPNQRLFQWDNGTDIVCWEPEYGATKMLVDLFAEQTDKYLELYVGKSDYVDYLLEYDHRGHTTCCWSLGTETQCREVEKRTASMQTRIESARKCQQAGYGVRIRLSPMVPLVGWEDETRHMLRQLFSAVTPEVVTIEPLRFHTHEQLLAGFPEGSLDQEFVDSMLTIPDDARGEDKRNFPDEYRVRMYRVVLEEIEKLSPRTPVAFCREKRTVWESLHAHFDRMGQYPDDFVCNCGPKSAGAGARLVTVGA
jgi:DNA repair photolyase